MNSYFNNTRVAAIVTVKVESSNQPNKSFSLAEPGEDKVTEPVKAVVGYHDVQVGPGKELRVEEGTVATFISVRSLQ